MYKYNFYQIQTKDHPYTTSAKGLGGWAKKSFFYFHYYSIYADIVGGSKKVQTFADVIYGWSPCEKDLKRVLQKNHRILTIAKHFFESINYLSNIIGKRSLWFGILRKKNLVKLPQCDISACSSGKGIHEAVRPFKQQAHYGGASAC